LQVRSKFAARLSETATVKAGVAVTWFVTDCPKTAGEINASKQTTEYETFALTVTTFYQKDIPAVNRKS